MAARVVCPSCPASVSGADALAVRHARMTQPLLPLGRRLCGARLVGRAARAVCPPSAGRQHFSSWHRAVLNKTWIQAFVGRGQRPPAPAVARAVTDLGTESPTEAGPDATAGAASQASPQAPSFLDLGVDDRVVVSRASHCFRSRRYR